MLLNPEQIRAMAGPYSGALVDFLQDLVRIPSVNGRDSEHAVAERVSAEADRLGLDAALHAKDPEHPNVLVSWGGGARGFALIGHLDTVAEGGGWPTPPFEAQIKEGRMIGRGTADNKAGIACGLYTIALLRDMGLLDPARHRVLLAGVADEESGASSPDGVRFLLDEGLLKADGAIYTYASDIVCIGHRGLLRLWIESQGQAVHSGSDAWSRGEAGVNAVTGLAEALLALEKLAAARNMGAAGPGAGQQVHSEPADSLGQDTVKKTGTTSKHPDPLAGLGLTITPGTLVEGGEFESMVPSKARAAVDIRIPPGTSAQEVLQKIEDRLAIVRAGRPGLQLEISVKNNLPAAMIAPDHPLARLAQQHARTLAGGEWPIRIAGPANEGYMLIGAGIPTLPGFGPEGGNAHAPGEWVGLESLATTVAIYASVIRDYLNMQGSLKDGP